MIEVGDTIKDDCDNIGVVRHIGVLKSKSGYSGYGESYWSEWGNKDWDGKIITFTNGGLLFFTLAPVLVKKMSVGKKSKEVPVMANDVVIRKDVLKVFKESQNAVFVTKEFASGKCLDEFLKECALKQYKKDVLDEARRRSDKRNKVTPVVTEATSADGEDGAESST